MESPEVLPFAPLQATCRTPGTILRNGAVPTARSGGGPVVALGRGLERVLIGARSRPQTDGNAQ